MCCLKQRHEDPFKDNLQNKRPVAPRCHGSHVLLNPAPHPTRVWLENDGAESKASPTPAKDADDDLEVSELPCSPPPGGAAVCCHLRGLVGLGWNVRAKVKPADFFSPTPSASSQTCELTEGSRTVASLPCRPVSFTDALRLAALHITAICCRNSPSAAC